MVGFRSVGFDAAPGDGCRISEHLLSFREVKCLWLFQDYRNSFIKIKSCQFIKSICGLVVRTYHLYSDDLSLITKGSPDWSLFWWSLCLESMGIINFYFVSWSNRVIMLWPQGWLQWHHFVLVFFQRIGRGGGGKIVSLVEMLVD